MKNENDEKWWKMHSQIGRDEIFLSAIFYWFSLFYDCFWDCFETAREADVGLFRWAGFSCTLGESHWPAANASGCDLGAASIYGTTGGAFATRISALQQFW